MNNLTLIGNVVNTPELVEYTEGKQLANFRIAVNLDRGTDRERTSFMDVTVFGPQASYVVKTLAKGDRVIAHGELTTRPYETDAGEKRTRYSLTAQAVGVSLEFQAAKVTHKERQEAVEPV